MHFNFQNSNANEPITMVSQSLYAVGKQLERECIRATRNHEYAKSNDSYDALIKAQGKLEGYLQTSRALCNKVCIHLDTTQPNSIILACNDTLEKMKASQKK